MIWIWCLHNVAMKFYLSMWSLVRDSIFYLKFECKGIPQGSPRITEIFISPLHTGRLAGRRWAWNTWRLSDHEKSATALPKRSKNLIETNPLPEFIWNFIAFQDSWWDPGPSLYLWGVRSLWFSYGIGIFQQLMEDSSLITCRPRITMVTGIGP
jgi:hypothetical protein